MSSIRQLIYYKGKPVALAAVLFLLLFMTPGITAAQGESLQYISGQTTFFSGVDYSLQWLQNDLPVQQHGPMLFAIYQANRAVLKIPVKPGIASTRGVIFQVDFQYPEIKAGIDIETQAVVLAQKSDSMWVKVFQAPFYFFSRQFQIGPRPYYTEFKIGIIDRSVKQTLMSLLQETGISFSRVSSLNDFHGKWLLCCGLDFKGDHVLFSELLGLAKKGISVVVFPPLTGTFPLPAYQPGLQIMLGDQKLVQRMDARINLTGSEAEFQKPAVSFLLKNSDPGIAIHCSPAKDGFNWLELIFEQGTIFFCGWDVGSMFTKNPSVALLINKILNHRSAEANHEKI